jgi:hypothetical protein
MASGKVESVRVRYTGDPDQMEDYAGRLRHNVESAGGTMASTGVIAATVGRLDWVLTVPVANMGAIRALLGILPFREVGN